MAGLALRTLILVETPGRVAPMAGMDRMPCAERLHRSAQGGEAPEGAPRRGEDHSRSRVCSWSPRGVACNRQQRDSATKGLTLEEIDKRWRYMIEAGGRNCKL